MRNKVLGVLGVVVVVLGVICAVAWRELRASRLRLAKTQQTLEAETAARAVQEDRTRLLERQRSNLNQQVDQFTTLVNQLRASESSRASNAARLAAQTVAPHPSSDTNSGGLFGGKGVGDMLSKMMKDPAMKEMMRAQQKVVMQKMYGPLLKDWNLPAEQKARFMDLLQEHQMSAIDQAGAFFGEGEKDKAQAAQEIKEKEEQMSANLKELLGEERFAQYEDYKKSMGERMQLDEFRKQMEDGDSRLGDDQMRSLMLVMREERERVPPVVTDNNGESTTDLARLFTGDTLERQAQWQEDFNRRVLERAGQVLTPQQLKEFDEFQSQQINLQRVGLRMAREMFKSGGDSQPEVKAPVTPPTR